MNANQYSEDKWRLLNDEIHKRFRILAAQILVVAPRCNPRFGKTVTKVFPLFSHVSFKRDDDIDIIVGVDISLHDGQWQIIADITEEESGTIYFELSNLLFRASSFEELQDRVLRDTELLISRGTPILLRQLEPTVPGVLNQTVDLVAR